MSGSVRDNILFFHPFKQEFYDHVLDGEPNRKKRLLCISQHQACALRPDLATFSDGDATMVGEKGTSAACAGHRDVSEHF